MQILHILYSAHQGVTHIIACANVLAYCPGIHASIQNIRYTCQSWNEMAPLTSKEPIAISLPPEWPFCKFVQIFSSKVVIHIFQLWIDLVGRSISTTFSRVTTQERNLSLHSGFCFKHLVFQKRLVLMETTSLSQLNFRAFSKIGASVTASSAYYPQSNGQAERGVKTSKRILKNNSSSDGTINNDQVSHALLEYCNT